MSRQVITFASVGLAQRLIAGTPACTRACLAGLAGGLAAKGQVTMGIPGGKLNNPHCGAEMERLCAGQYVIVDTNDLLPSDIRVSGEALILSAASNEPDLATVAAALADYEDSGDARAERRVRNKLDQAGWALVKATGKRGDGIVSRYINRHISMRISFALLQLPWIRPGHATLLTALCAAAMLAALLSGTPDGLVAGAILFQLASVIDGVDGEIARVTQRTSALGATLDTVTDGITNVGFIVGLTANLAMQNEYLALEIGMFGALSLALGCAILASKSLQEGGAMSFDGVAIWMRQRPGPMQDIVIAITKRDFFAFASMIMIFLSLAKVLLITLSASCLIWLLFVQHVARNSIPNDAMA
jgi:1L-myo-inositol 1-phosphate cytidylyltransferase / CDP-L-myo-inositol myo-inositolphosphotransferase